MKHLKTYSESISHQTNEEISNDINDILLELTDIGFSAIDSDYSNGYGYQKSPKIKVKEVVGKRGTGQRVDILIKKNNSKLFYISEINDVVLRLNDYMESVGFYHSHIPSKSELIINDEGKVGWKYNQFLLYFARDKEFYKEEFNWNPFRKKHIISEQDIREICYELTDTGNFEIQFLKKENEITAWQNVVSHNVVRIIPSKKENFRIHESKFELTDEVKETIFRIVDYLGRNLVSVFLYRALLGYRSRILYKNKIGCPDIKDLSNISGDVSSIDIDYKVDKTNEEFNLKNPFRKEKKIPDILPIDPQEIKEIFYDITDIGNEST